MRNNRPHILHDERGMSLVFVCLGFMAMLSATTLAIDIGMFMNSRSQAQNAADAGALAGAVALVYNNYTDRSASGPAVQSAINTARTNKVGGQPVSIGAADVTFPNDPAGQPNRVAVQVFRTAARSNPVPTLMGMFFGVNNVDISATATAEASFANAETCMMPFTISDKWTEKGTGPWDPNDTFDPGDVYIGLKPNDPNTNYTGFNAERDRGVEMILKADNGSKVTASFYNPWDLPGSSGASDYRANIAGCNPAKSQIGDMITPEPGNMVGPTKQGTDDLVAKDPNAVWNDTCNCVQHSAFGKSPRIVIIPVYDPVVFAAGPQHGKNIALKIANFIGFFIEDMTGSEVKGRITPVGGIIDDSLGPAPTGSFPKVIRLVQ
jgi:Flp pilus assembly protein TadG